MDFRDRYGPWALVAGASDGIGAAFARRLADLGLNVLIVARRQTLLNELAAEIMLTHPAIEVRTITQDLAEEDSIEAIAEATAGLDVGCLVYSVGAESRYAYFLDHEWATLRDRVTRNFVVKLGLVHHFGRPMRARGYGGMILMGSIAGLSGSPGFALYGASKAFTHNLAEALWYELRQAGVDLLCPVVGPTETPTMVNSYGPLAGTPMQPSYLAEHALARIARGPMWFGEDIAESARATLAMAPADRAATTAEFARNFAKVKP